MNILQKILNKAQDELVQDSIRPYQKGVYRCSEIGGCARALQYATLGYKGEKFSPEQALLFQDGHLHHHHVRSLLAKVGTLSCVEMNVSKKYIHNGQKFTLTGTLDCVYDGIVTDIKSITTFSFVKLHKDFPDNYENYMFQIQMYMDMLNIKKGMFVFKNKNDSELKIVRTNYDPAVVTKALDRVALVHQGVRHKQITMDKLASDDWHCRYCRFRLVCKRMPMEQRTWPAPRTGPSEWVAGTKDRSGSTNGEGLAPTLRRSLKAKRKDL